MHKFRLLKSMLKQMVPFLMSSLSLSRQRYQDRFTFTDAGLPVM